MNKILKKIGKLFKSLYNLLDKSIITPISRAIYYLNKKLKSNTSHIEKVLNRPNILIYLSLAFAVIVFFLVDSKVINLVETEAEVLTNQPVNVLYNKEAYVVEGLVDTVDIILTGRKSDLYLAKQLGDHEVLLDLTDYSASNEPYKVKLNQAKAQLEQAKAVSKNANLLYKRNFSLCKKKLISQQECDNITTKKQQADANVKLAQAVVDEAKLSYNYTKLYAFDDGVVLTRIYEKGTILNAGYPVYSMILNKNMWVRTYIDEVNLGKVKLGTKVKIYADFSDKAYEGHIGFISPMAEFTPKNIETESLRPDLVYKIRVLVDNPDDYLKQGMPVTLEINK